MGAFLFFKRDTAHHLEWLKTVKDSHGSVELSSLSLASSINKKGIYLISAPREKKVLHKSSCWSWSPGVMVKVKKMALPLHPFHSS